MGGVEGRDFDVFMSEATVTMSNDLQEFASRGELFAVD
jgi:hypothetical protein